MGDNGESSVIELAAVLSGESGRLRKQMPKIAFPARPTQLLQIALDLSNETEAEIERIVRDQLGISDGIKSSRVEVFTVGSGTFRTLADVVETLSQVRELKAEVFISTEAEPDPVATAPTVATRKVA